ncbi:MAG: efflux RND transporter periplasmic adaptor subunit, partial [Planctomycetota bacterium]
AAGGGGYYVMQSDAAENATSIAPEMLFSATRGNLRVTIVENGELMAQNSEKVTPGGRRGWTITWLIEEGARVEEGDQLAQLDTTEHDDRKTELELEIVRTEADLDTARTELEIQQSENLANIEKAEIALRRADQELEKYTDGDAPKERRELEIDIKDKETAFERAKKKYEDSLRLLKDDYITRSQVEQDRIDYERSQVQLVSAQRNLELFEKYTYPLTLLDKQTAVKDANRELQNAEKRAQSMLRQKEVAVESTAARLKQQKDQLEETIERIEQCTITAPLPGIVIYGDPDEPWYRTNIRIGGQIWGGATMFTIPDLRVMQVKISVHEADINKLEEGQTATVTMDTYPGLVLSGKVTKIASIAGGGGSPWEQNDEVKKFSVNITLDKEPSLELRPGISAKAEVFIEERNDVMYVPIQCVFLQEGTHYAYRVGSDGRPQRVRVETGMSNDRFMEIRGGLSEGDQVLLYNPRLQDVDENIDEEFDGDNITPSDTETDDAADPDMKIAVDDGEVSDDDGTAEAEDVSAATFDDGLTEVSPDAGADADSNEVESVDDASASPDENEQPNADDDEENDSGAGETDATASRPAQEVRRTPAGSSAELTP